MIVLEVLNSLILRHIEAGKLQVHPKCKDPMLTHLLFADDLFWFTKPTVANIQSIMEILDDFKVITGLQINMQKSSIIFAGVENQIKNDILAISGLSELPPSSFYLGLPLITRRITTTDCLPLYEKITEKLHTWHNLHISQSGRLTIIQSIATAMTTYWSRHYILPKKLIGMINRALARFLWHGDPNMKKIVPIALHKIQLPKRVGGLGIQNLKIWNIAAMSKYYDLLLSGSGNLWAGWVRKNLIGRKNFWSMDIPASASWSWRNILKLRSTFLPLLRCNPVASPDLQFWKEPWADYGLILSDVLSTALQCQTGIPFTARVADYFCDGVISLPHTSSAIVRDVWNSIESRNYDQADRHVTWKTGAGLHSIKDIYNLLIPQHEPFPWFKRIWSSYGPLRNNLLLWKVMANAILTKDKLLRMNITQDDTCVLCGSLPESNTHIFFNCTYVYWIWSMLLADLCFHRPSSNSHSEWFSIYKHTRWKTVNALILLALLKRLVAAVWAERNQRVFYSICISKENLFHSIRRSISLDINSIRRAYPHTTV